MVLGWGCGCGVSFRNSKRRIGREISRDSRFIFVFCGFVLGLFIDVSVI